MQSVENGSVRDGGGVAPWSPFWWPGDPVPAVAARRGPFERFIRGRAGDAWGRGRWATYEVRRGAPLPGPRDADAFIMTGSSSSVTERAPWMLRAEELLRQIAAARVPMLGICFGHQMLAQALGGEVRRNPFGREIGTVRLTRVADDPVFAGLPRVFDVHETHVDAVVKLPPGAEVLATTSLDPAAVFRVGGLIRGVQFHPELDADIMRGYVAARAADHPGRGRRPRGASSGASTTGRSGTRCSGTSCGSSSAASEGDGVRGARRRVTGTGGGRRELGLRRARRVADDDGLGREVVRLDGRGRPSLVPRASRGARPSRRCSSGSPRSSTRSRGRGYRSSGRHWLRT